MIRSIRCLALGLLVFAMTDVPAHTPPPAPSVATEAWIVSLVAKVLDAIVTLLSAPTALPRSTEDTIAAAVVGGAGIGSAGAGAATVAGVLAGGMAAVSSFFLQPATATVAISAAAMAREMRLRIMVELLVMSGLFGRTARAQPFASGSFRTWPGKILSGSSIWSRLASKMACQWLALP
jgi:hypothetical protein